MINKIGVICSLMPLKKHQKMHQGLMETELQVSQMQMVRIKLQFIKNVAIKGQKCKPGLLNTKHYHSTGNPLNIFCRIIRLFCQSIKKSTLTALRDQIQTGHVVKLLLGCVNRPRISLLLKTEKGANGNGMQCNLPRKNRALPLTI